MRGQPGWLSADPRAPQAPRLAPPVAAVWPEVWPAAPDRVEPPGKAERVGPLQAAGAAAATQEQGLEGWLARPEWWPGVPAARAPPAPRAPQAALADSVSLAAQDTAGPPDEVERVGPQQAVEAVQEEALVESLVRPARRRSSLGAMVALGMAASTLTCVDSEGNVASAPSRANADVAGSAGADAFSDDPAGAGGASTDAGPFIINAGGAEGIQLDAGALVNLDAAPVRTCDQCGAARETACAASFSSCRDRPACAALLDCVYLTEQCALDSSGAVCVRACAEVACADPPALELFLSAEVCAFCTEECLTDCSGYCTALAALEALAADCVGSTGTELPADAP